MEENSCNSNCRLLLKSLDNHSAVGFDVDHCLVRYNIKALTRVCYESLMLTLVSQKHYAEELLLLDDDEMGIGLNYSVIDINNGTILKIGEGNVILTGYRGFDRINVETEYGLSC